LCSCHFTSLATAQVKYKSKLNHQLRLSQNADTTSDRSSFHQFRRPISCNNPFNVNRRATINKLLSRKIPRFKAKGRSQAGTASAHLWDRPFPKPKKIPPVGLLRSSKLPLGQPPSN
jgi:hypothetical protein